MVSPTCTAVRCANAPWSTPLASGWQVLEHGPFRMKTAAGWLKSHGAGSLEVKRRRSPVEPEALRKKLKGVLLPGGTALTLFLTRLAGRSWMLLGRRL